MEVIVGTGGHIDHGKTALVKALTGIDADRLPEEKRRGITVDLGFAEMTIGDVHIGFVDVPGHERFVKNMLAGASGIDLVLLVVAADEGVMPQTREHFDICRLLGIRHGVIALTKTDLVDDETLEIARTDAAQLVADSPLENAPIIGLSARTHKGLDELRSAIGDIAKNLPVRAAPIGLVLAIDRSFTMKGYGAVVTGTLASDEIAEGDEVELLPQKTKLRVRGLQTHGQAVKTATAGQRVAVNLAGIDHNEIGRGMRLSEPGMLLPTQIIDARIEVLSTAAKPLRSRSRVRVHIGTAEILARIEVLNEQGVIEPGNTDLAQLRFETATVALPGERFIVRSYSPQHTVAGGIVIDNLSDKHRKKDFSDVRSLLIDLFDAIEDVERAVLLRVNSAKDAGISLSALRNRTAAKKNILRDAISANIVGEKIVDADGIYLARSNFESLAAEAEKAIKEFHFADPLAKGISREALRDGTFKHIPPQVFQAVVSDMERTGRIAIEKDALRLAAHQTNLSPADAELSERIAATYRENGLAAAKLDEVLDDIENGNANVRAQARKLFHLLVSQGKIVKVTDEFYFSAEAITRLQESLRTFAAKSSDRMIDVPAFKDLAGISRKYAIPLLEYFDRERVTVRVGDKRKVL